MLKYVVMAAAATLLAGCGAGPGQGAPPGQAAPPSTSTPTQLTLSTAHPEASTTRPKPTPEAAPNLSSEKAGPTPQRLELSERGKTNTIPPPHAQAKVSGSSTANSSKVAPVTPAPTWKPGKNTGSKEWLAKWPTPGKYSPTQRGALTGKVVAIDPGHNLGNFTHPEINDTYWVGFNKVCNTTGTATADGYREAQYTLQVAHLVRKDLTAMGATVYMTRYRDQPNTYGPCIGARGAFGKAVGADLTVSIHADGQPGLGQGFHVIVPTKVRGYSDDIYTSSKKLATHLINAFTTSGYEPARYLQSALVERSDIGGLLTSDVPAVVVETLNMGNPKDARHARSAQGRAQVGAAIADGVRTYLTRP